MITLGIESAVAGGGLSIRLGHDELGRWTAGTEILRSEMLLPEIDRLLLSNDISKDAIAKIAVSAGPGSFTGIRIGIATASGLSRSLSTGYRQISLLAAMAASSGISGRITAAVPLGRKMVCRQTFDCTAKHIASDDKIVIFGQDEMPRQFTGPDNDAIIVHSSLMVPDVSGTECRAISNLAGCISLAATDDRLADDSPLLFISKPS